MAGHIDRHSGAQLHRVFHHLLIGLRCLFKVLHAGIQDDWQRLRIVIDMFGQRLVDFHQTGTVGSTETLIGSLMIFTLVPGVICYTETLYQHRAGGYSLN